MCFKLFYCIIFIFYYGYFVVLTKCLFRMGSSNVDAGLRHHYHHYVCVYDADAFEYLMEYFYVYLDYRRGGGVRKAPYVLPFELYM